MATKVKDIKLSRSKPVKGTCKLTGNTKIYEKLSDAKEDGFDIGKISMCCNGKRGSHKNYLWEYLPTASKREQLLNQSLYTVKILNISNDLKLGTFQCECGDCYTASIDMVRQGFTTTCEDCKLGSYKMHKFKYPHLVSIYSNMKTRCTNPNSESYKEYGAKGITVCDEWSLSFDLFLEWSLNNDYSENLSLDRKELDKGYTPDNCRWVSKCTQSQNTRVLMSTNTSGYRGVSAYSCGKWQSEIQHNFNKVYLGLYDTAIEAAIAYDTYVYNNKTEHNPNFSEVKLQELLDSIRK